MPVTDNLFYPQGFKTDSRNVGKTAHPPIVSADRSGTVWQVAVFYNGAGRLVVARRNRTSGAAWEVWVPSNIAEASTGGTDDHHNQACVGIDLSGRIHISYDHHDDPLNYRISDQPVESFDGAFGASLNMVNSANEGNVTYPRFFTDPAGNLYFIFRDGQSGDGNWYFYAWDDGAASWSAATGTGTDGLLIDGKASSVNPYGSSIAGFDADFNSGSGLMHLFWIWRETTDSSTNHDLQYVAWDGSAFERADGTAQTVPITEANAETAVAIAENSGLLAPQVATQSTSGGLPLHAYARDDGSGNMQIFVAYRSGGAWAETQVTNLSAGDSGDASPWCDLVLDRATDTAYIILRVLDEYRLWTSGAGDFSTWTADGALYAPSAGLVGVSNALSRTPHHDPYQWRQETRWEAPYQRGITYTG